MPLSPSRPATEKSGPPLPGQSSPRSEAELQNRVLVELQLDFFHTSTLRHVTIWAVVPARRPAPERCRRAAFAAAGTTAVRGPGRPVPAAQALPRAQAEPPRDSRDYAQSTAPGRFGPVGWCIVRCKSRQTSRSLDRRPKTDRSPHRRPLCERNPSHAAGPVAAFSPPPLLALFEMRMSWISMGMVEFCALDQQLGQTPLIHHEIQMDGHPLNSLHGCLA